MSSGKNQIWRIIVSILAVVIIAVIAIWYLWSRVHPSLEASKLVADTSVKLAWPVVVLVTAFILRKSLRSVGQSVHTRVREGDNFEARLGNFALALTSSKRFDRSNPDLVLEEEVNRAEEVGVEIARTRTDQDAEEVLIEHDPDVAMLRAFLDLEEILKEVFERRNLQAFESSAIISTSIRPISTRIEKFLDPPLRRVLQELRSVRNGIVHGKEKGYSADDAREYMKQTRELGQLIENYGPAVRTPNIRSKKEIGVSGPALDGAEKITIDLSEWTRLAEVEEYANWRNLALDEAIRALVNSGLSHWDRR